MSLLKSVEIACILYTIIHRYPVTEHHLCARGVLSPVPFFTHNSHVSLRGSAGEAAATSACTGVSGWSRQVLHAPGQGVGET